MKKINMFEIYDDKKYKQKHRTVNFEYLKYQQEFIENEGMINYSNFVNNITFDRSYTANVKKAIRCLFCDTTNFNPIIMYTLLNGIKNANVKKDVKSIINKLYSFDNGIKKSEEPNLTKYKYLSLEIEGIQSSFPPQVLNFFKEILERPKTMNEIDVIAILGIVKDTRISMELNEYINQLMNLTNIKNEDDLKNIFDDEKIYEESLFKKHIHCEK